ncbi:MAG TPA: glycosyltransferase [Mobilitalea sp.]|nr:glycosyltransferase [Mobilitalea sp.]
MKIIQINTFPYKATGSIMMNLHRLMQNQGIESYAVWGRGRKPGNEYEISLHDYFGMVYHGVYSRITDKTGFASKRATQKLIDKLKEIKPDIIHLHNIHGYYINIEMLFRHIREQQIKVVWTLHDCWSFTGHCAYFDMIECEKWKYGCHDCWQLNTYPVSKVMDNSEWNYQRKKELFTGLDITIITPCSWLCGLVKQSYLKPYPVKVIYNGIDRNVFRPTESDFRAKHGLEGKFIVLGVASEWTVRKGLQDFIRLSTLLNDDYKIVVIGLTKKQVKEMPASILAMERTSNVQELVEIYSTADIFFNPTYEDNFPSTNLEAIACGTPVCTYQTGGSPESLNHNSGIVLPVGQINIFAAMIRENRSPKYNMKFDIDEAMDGFEKEDMLKNYLTIYRTIGEDADGIREWAG